MSHSAAAVVPRVAFAGCCHCHGDGSASLCTLLVKMQIALYRKAPIDLDDPDEGIAPIVEQAHYFAISG